MTTYQIGTKEELRELLKDLLNELLPPLSTGSETTQLLTRKEAAKLLKVSLPTLSEYTKEGIISGKRYGSRILYRKDDILKSGTVICSLKYRIKCVK